MQGVGTGRLIASRYALRRKRAALGAIEVWAADDSTLGREVSITVLPASDPHADALLEAARRSAGVNDHRFVRVLDVGSRGEIAWVVEESLSESTSIADLIADGPLPPEEARRIAGEVATALSVSARQGLHHLHITPHAVRRTKAGLVKIAGLATAAAVEDTAVPDELEAQRVDALGVTALLYTAMTGQWPLRTTVPGLPHAPRVGTAVAAPADLAVAVPDDLDELCLDAFARSNAPRTPEDLATRLGPWSHTLVRHIAPTRPPVADPTERIPRVRPPAETPTTAAPAPAPRTVRPARKPSHRELRAHNKAAQAAEERREIAARRRDPGFLDVPTALDASTGPLEPPAPLVAAPVEREGRHAKVVLGIVAVLVVLATLVAVMSLAGAFKDMNAAVSPSGTSTPAAASSAPQKRPKPSDAASSTDADAITFASARAHDPQGDGSENNGGVRKAHDGDPATFWQSEGYKAADYQGQKPGVGIAFQLPAGRTPSSVSVVLGERTQNAAVYVSSSPNIQNATRIGTFDDATGEQTATVPDEARGNARYVIVWVTRAMQHPDGKYRAVISEVTAR